MKYLILFIVITSFGSIIYGFNILEDQESLGHKCIGLGTAGIFLLAMPLFLFKASKGKKMKDYMLTEENIKKMKEEKAEKPENQ